MKNKMIKKIIKIYPPVMYFLLEKWLRKMSSNGWHLIKRKFFIYYFEKGEPEKREYFVWSPSYTGEGKYSIPLRYPKLTITYGKKKQKSKLNKNSYLKHETIIEIDTQKIDIQNDVGYKELIDDRNRLYLRCFIRNLCIVITILLIVVMFLILL